MARTGSMWLVVNSASGSNDEESIRALTAGFEAAGFTPQRVVDCQSDTLPDKAAAEAGGTNLIAVFAGDGTVGSLIGGLEGWSGEVLVLPGGTANLLAHALHGDTAAVRIIELLGQGILRPARRSCVESSQGRALIELLAGPGATWSAVREGLREGDLAEIASSTLEAVRQSAAGPMVSIAKPKLGREGGYVGVRLEPTEQGMDVRGYGAENVGDLIKQGMALLRRNFREGPHDELGHHHTIVCRSQDGSPIELMIDGERSTGTGEERFVQRPFAVSFLATPEDYREHA